MSCCQRLTTCVTLMFIALPAHAQNVVSSCEVHTYQRFVRITLAMPQPPVFTASEQPGLDEAVGGEVCFSFANTRLAAGFAVPVYPSIQIGLLQVDSSGEVRLSLTPRHAFTFNAFYFAPKRTFIIDVLRRDHALKKPRSEFSLAGAMGALARRDTATALAALQSIMARNPAHAAANYHVGLIRLARGDTEMARQNFLRAATNDSTYAHRTHEQLLQIAAKAGSLSANHLHRLRTWIRGNHSRIWWLSSAFAVLGAALIASYVRSARASKRHLSFSSLVEESSGKLNMRLADVEHGARLEHTEPLARRPAAPFALPAPILEGQREWPSIAADISSGSVPDGAPAGIARRLGVGQGEIELHWYMQKHEPENRPGTVKPLRLTFAEG